MNVRTIVQFISSMQGLTNRIFFYFLSFISKDIRTTIFRTIIFSVILFGCEKLVSYVTGRTDVEVVRDLDVFFIAVQP